MQCYMYMYMYYGEPPGKGAIGKVPFPFITSRIFHFAHVHVWLQSCRHLFFVSRAEWALEGLYLFHVHVVCTWITCVLIHSSWTLVDT